jgi:hypothetical protein
VRAMKRHLLGAANSFASRLHTLPAMPVSG